MFTCRDVMRLRRRHLIRLLPCDADCAALRLLTRESTDYAMPPPAMPIYAAMRYAFAVTDSMLYYCFQRHAR